MSTSEGVCLIIGTVFGFLGTALLLMFFDIAPSYRQHMIETGVAKWETVDGEAQFVLVKPPVPANP